MKKEDVKTKQEAIEYMADINCELAKLESMETDFLSKDLEFLAMACRDRMEDLYGMIINPDDYPSVEGVQDRHQDSDPSQLSEGENSLRFRVLELLKEGQIQRSAEVVTDYIMDALGDMGPSVDGLRNMDRLVACSLRVIFAHWAPPSSGGRV